MVVRILQVLKPHDKPHQTDEREVTVVNCLVYTVQQLSGISVTIICNTILEFPILMFGFGTIRNPDTHGGAHPNDLLSDVQ